MQKIDLSELQIIIKKLKLKRPVPLIQHQKEKQIKQFNDFSFSIQQQSIIEDNYSDSNCFSFFKTSTNNHLNKNHQTQLSQFDSIIDKLKTEGDVSQPSGSFYQTQKQIQKQQINQRQRAVHHKQSYFSQKQLKLHSKSYKNISSMKKKTMQEPINAKLTLDKQNFHIYSNESHHSSVQKMKKTFNSSIKIANSISNQKLKRQKQKIIASKGQTQRKGLNENKNNSNVSKHQYQSKTASPLPFRHSKIEPHKFSSYKMRLF